MSTPARSRTRRAVSEADKSARRQSILIAADQHFRTVGFEKFSMEVLSKELEVARGTLYRYFSTREELLLNLYQRQQQQFVDQLIESTSKPVSDSMAPIKGSDPAKSASKMANITRAKTRTPARG